MTNYEGDGLGEADGTSGMTVNPITIVVDGNEVTITRDDWRPEAAAAVRDLYPGCDVIDDLRWASDGYYPHEDRMRYRITYGMPVAGHTRAIFPEGSALAEMPGALAAATDEMAARHVAAGRRR